MLHIEIFAHAQWPLPEATLHWAYLCSGLLIASHYGPLLRRAWLQPAATVLSQPQSTWAVWTLCRIVAFTYGIFILHDLVFLVVVGADIAGRFGMAVLILRAHWLMGRGRARIPLQAAVAPRG